MSEDRQGFPGPRKKRAMGTGIRAVEGVECLGFLVEKCGVRASGSSGWMGDADV